MTAATCSSQSLALAPGNCLPPGQRTGSLTVEVPVDCELALLSAGPGARKPSEYVPRKAKVFSGVHLAPSFGVVDEKRSYLS
ncbi:hypothetical protein D3C72_1608760 [compost metagenome]